MISGSIRKAPTLLGLAVMQTIAIGLGLVLLIIPGLIATAAWLLTAPVLMAERTGLVGAFFRSPDLTRGYRWRVFILIVAYCLIFVILGLIDLSTQAGVNHRFAMAGTQLSWFTILINAAFTAMLGVISTVGASAVYYELRRIGEPGTPQALVDTFS